MLKKLFLIVLIAILAYCQAGYYFVMRYSQSAQKEAVKQKIIDQLKDKEFQVISLTDNHKKIYWEEEGNEFLFNGEMYDVVKTKLVNGKVILYCINDKKEKELVDNYNLVTKQNSSPDKKEKNTIDNSFNLFVYQDEKNVDHFVIHDLNRFYFIEPHFTQGITDKISPPPKPRIIS